MSRGYILFDYTYVTFSKKQNKRKQKKKNYRDEWISCCHRNRARHHGEIQVLIQKCNIRELFCSLWFCSISCSSD